MGAVDAVNTGDVTGGCERGRTWNAVAMVVVAVLATTGCGGQGLSVPADDAWVRTQDDATQVSVELPGTAEKQTQNIPTPDGGAFPVTGRLGRRGHALVGGQRPRFGWHHPAWARIDGTNPERWHWEYRGGGQVDTTSVAC